MFFYAIVMWLVVCVGVRLPSECDGSVHVSTASPGHRLKLVHFVYCDGSFCLLGLLILCLMNHIFYNE